MKWKALAAFEKWQVLLGIIQTVVLLLTFTAASYIGVQQNRINQSLYDLNFQLTPEIAYSDHRLIITNKGKEPIWLWGTRFADEIPSSERSPRFITPGGFYYILGDRLEALALAKIGHDGEARWPLEVYLKAGDQRSYIVQVILYCQVVKDAVAIHTQTLAVTPASWPELPAFRAS